jgi:LacI family transcriptional regulator
MRDVAALAGVSLKTVSRVINGEVTVDPELALRVNRAATVLDYRPNFTARSLRSGGGRTRTIGLLLENVANPFSSTMHRAIADAADARSIAVFAASVDEDPRRERTLALALTSRRVDGLIVVPAGEDQSYLASEQRSGLSIVFADRPPSLLRADCVTSDNAGGAAVGVTHLIESGHRRIAFLGDRHSIATARERFDGYRAALTQAGIEYDEALVRWDLHNEETALQATADLLQRPHIPTALFTSQNLITIGAIRALRALELEHHVALVGFDDLPLFDLLNPAVTVVAQDPAAIGTSASELLFSRMDGDDSPPRLRTIETRLLVRGSGKIPPPH